MAPKHKHPGAHGTQPHVKKALKRPSTLLSDTCHVEKDPTGAIQDTPTAVVEHGQCVGLSAKQKRKGRGYEKNGGGNATEVLQKLRKDGKNITLPDGTLFALTDEDIALVQSIANVETGGQIGGVNTWDNMVVSIGWIQWTLGNEEIQKLIQSSKETEAAFKEYGIEVDAAKGRVWRIAGRKVLPIKGVEHPNDLRLDRHWFVKFYLASLDERILAQEVKLGMQRLQEGVDREYKHAAAPSKASWADYHSNPNVGRAYRLLAEVFNNRESFVRNVLDRAYAAADKLQLTKKPGEKVTQAEFEGLLDRAIPDAYEELETAIIVRNWRKHQADAAAKRVQHEWKQKTQEMLAKAEADWLQQNPGKHFPAAEKHKVQHAAAEQEHEAEGQAREAAEAADYPADELEKVKRASRTKGEHIVQKTR
jgi:hypothetical protein